MTKKNNILKEKLYNHKMLIDESFWAEMENRLRKPKQKKISLLWWFCGMGMAASLALLFTLQPSIKNVQNTENQANVVFQKEKNKQINEKTSEQTNNLEDSQFDVEKNIGRKGAKLQNEKKNEQNNKEIGEQIKNLADLQFDVENNTEKIEIQKFNPKKSLSDFKNNNKTDIRKNKSKKSWLAAANIGFGGVSVSNLGGGNMYFDEKSEPNNVSSGFTDINASQSLEELLFDYPQVTHLPPLAFGLSVRKNLNKHLAVETGLTYTYLRTKFRKENGYNIDEATMQQHFLGIPLNLILNIVNNRKWNLYFSAGGMIEKGLWLDYNRTITYTNPNQSVYNQNYTDDIKPLQFSLNGAIGVAVPFTNYLSIYFEPKIACYFQNNLPVSIRTESPLNVELKAGLRVEF